MSVDFKIDVEALLHTDTLSFARFRDKSGNEPSAKEAENGVVTQNNHVRRYLLSVVAVGMSGWHGSSVCLVQCPPPTVLPRRTLLDARPCLACAALSLWIHPWRVGGGFASGDIGLLPKITT